MARRPRKESKLQIYHVIMRGNNKQSIFFDDADNEFFIQRLFKYSAQLNISIYSYCLMGNHVHILLGNVSKQNLSLCIQKLANSYVYYFNHKYDCCGHLFQGRFKSEPIEDEVYLKSVLRYILNNPQKAGISKINEYKWSSYKDLIDFRQPPKIDTTFILNLFESRKTMLKFLNTNDNRSFMEYENKPFFTDGKAREIIQRILNVSNINFLRSLSIIEQASYLQMLKNTHFSLSQISRITGLPRKIIKDAYR